MDQLVYWAQDEQVQGPWPTRMLGDGRPHNLLLLVRSGHCEWEDRSLRCGQLLLRRHQILHPSLAQARRCRLLWCCFDTRSPLLLPELPACRQPDLAGALMLRLLAAFEQGGTRGGSAGGWLTALLHMLQEDNGFPERLREDPLWELVQAIDAEPWQQWTSAGLATSLGCSPRQLQRRFQQAVGCTPRSYVARARLDCAAGLMRETDWTLERIARTLGFSDQQHLGRRFRQRYGEAPSSWRRPDRDPPVSGAASSSTPAAV